MAEPRSDSQPVDETPLRIDYDNLDVADLMAQLKARAAARPEDPAAAASGELPANAVDLPISYPAPPAAAGGTRSRVKRILLTVMKPVTPLVKLAVLPVHEELVRAVEVLDYTNRKLDYLTAKSDHDLRVASEGLERRATGVDARMDELQAHLRVAAESTKLLHNLAHNLVVELTKLKIEHETLRTKVRILEKDFEVLGRRERALEKKVAP